MNHNVFALIDLGGIKNKSRGDENLLDGGGCSPKYGDGRKRKGLGKIAFRILRKNTEFIRSRGNTRQDDFKRSIFSSFTGCNYPLVFEYGKKRIR